MLPEKTSTTAKKKRDQTLKGKKTIPTNKTITVTSTITLDNLKESDQTSHQLPDFQLIALSAPSQIGHTTTTRKQAGTWDYPRRQQFPHQSDSSSTHGPRRGERDSNP